MRQFRTYGSVRGAAGNRCPYRNHHCLPMFVLRLTPSPALPPQGGGGCQQQGKWGRVGEMGSCVFRAKLEEEIGSECASTNWQVIVGESPIQERSSEPS